MFKLRIIFSLFSVLICSPASLYASCGEEIEVVRDQLAAEEAGVRAIEHRVRAARAEFLNRDAALREMMSNPPADYDRDLARRLVALRRSEVEPKREMLERLRSQHEEGRREWERGRQLLQTQLTEARAALDTQTINQQEYCQVREAYLQALSLYRDGMQGYRTGMDFYARALVAYGERFLLPYAQGFSDRQHWVVLTEQLDRGDFLQDLLVPMTATVLRSNPPAASQ